MKNTPKPILAALLLLAGLLAPKPALAHPIATNTTTTIPSINNNNATGQPLHLYSSSGDTFHRRSLTGIDVDDPFTSDILLEPIPGCAPPDEKRYMPAIDWDTDGCYNAVAMDAIGRYNPGLPLEGRRWEHCRRVEFLQYTNIYSRTHCQDDWCLHVYDYYFPKDQRQDVGHQEHHKLAARNNPEEHDHQLAARGHENDYWPPADGHVHDWEHIAVLRGRWSGDLWYVAISNAERVGVPEPQTMWTWRDVRRGRGRDKVQLYTDEEGHQRPKIVYHAREPAGFHSFRFAFEWGDDHPVENHRHKWQVHTEGLLSYNGFPVKGLREKLYLKRWDLFTPRWGSGNMATADINWLESMRDIMPPGFLDRKKYIGYAPQGSACPKICGLCPDQDFLDEPVFEKP